MITKFYESGNVTWVQVTACRMESQIPALVLCLKAYVGLVDAKYKSNIEEATK